MKFYNLVDKESNFKDFTLIADSMQDINISSEYAVLDMFPNDYL